jgi:hypothetical protein
MLNLHPETYLRLIEQDREREMAQRALERAARSGGSQRPGLARGGLNRIVGAVQRAGETVTRIRLGGRPATPSLGGSAGI